MRIPIDAAGQPFGDPELEARADEIAQRMPGCALPGCLACRSNVERARLFVIAIWNAAHDAAELDRAILETPAATTETVLAVAQAVADAWTQGRISGRLMQDLVAAVAELRKVRS